MTFWVQRNLHRQKDEGKHRFMCIKLNEWIKGVKLCKLVTTTGFHASREEDCVWVPWQDWPSRGQRCDVESGRWRHCVTLYTGCHLTRLKGRETETETETGRGRGRRRQGEGEGKNARDLSKVLWVCTHECASVCLSVGIHACLAEAVCDLFPWSLWGLEVRGRTFVGGAGVLNHYNPKWRLKIIDAFLLM